MNFDGFLGNERAKNYVNSAFANNAFPHALLITGERGIGKKTLAALISRALVCSEDEKPCNICNSCLKAKNLTHPDIRYISPEGGKSIGVKEIRNLKKDALLRPNDSDRKVYIINNADSLTHEAQDAFLKILEEPPVFTFFILLCYNLSDLLPTIVSRTAHIALSPLSDAEISVIIDERLPHLSKEERSELIRTCDGVCSFLSDAAASDSSESAKIIARALASQDEFEIFKAVSSLEKVGRDNFVLALNELILILRDALVLSTEAHSRLLSAVPSVSEDLAKIFPTRVFSDLIALVADAKSGVLRNVGTSHITGSLICNFAYISARADLKG